MRCISLFSGAGGLDLGLETAGFEISKSIDFDRDSCDTLNMNGQKNAICANINNPSSFDNISSKSIDLVVGGPPCQPFSKSALWTSKGATGFNDARSQTVDAYFEVIEKLRPRAFIFENVQGFISLGGVNIIIKKIRNLESVGLYYNLSYKILNAAEYGVPQHRKRFIAVGIRGSGPFTFPDSTHGPNKVPFFTAFDACADFISQENNESLNLKGKWADLIHTIPPGNNYLFHTNRGGGLPLFGWRTRYWSFLSKIDPLMPSPTITANPAQNCGPFHWHDRQLSTSELASIQTFPPSYHFAGDQISRRRQIGNAVPPLLAEVIGRALLEQFGCKCIGELQLMPKRASSEPKYADLREVPAKYHKYIGSHADHPGAGLGPKPRDGAQAMPQEAMTVELEQSKRKLIHVEHQAN